MDLLLTANTLHVLAAIVSHFWFMEGYAPFFHMQTQVWGMLDES